MISRVLDVLRCPHCHNRFTTADPALRCTAGHSFDIAKQGHVNLLGHAPGANADSAEMVAARLRVLESGLFAPLTDALIRATHAALASSSAPDPHAHRDATSARNAGSSSEELGDGGVVVDAGAGPGHHLGRIVAAVGARGVACDVSPAACRRAAKVPGVAAVVADTWAGLPVGDHGADVVVLSVFAPRNWADFARMTRRAVIVAAPGPGHLQSIRSAHQLLQVDADKFDELDQRAAAAGLECTDVIEVDHNATAEAALVADLVGMGPNAFHGAPQVTAAQPVEIAVRVATYRPTS